MKCKRRIDVKCRLTKFIGYTVFIALILLSVDLLSGCASQNSTMTEESLITAMVIILFVIIAVVMKNIIDALGGYDGDDDDNPTGRL